ncbi:MAG: carboxypeptidase regulatory-like domain-containing protein, partial [Acidobacteria bacterium]|nr:carboxypeptidase regulatory-like domain-containing protein [Acidobacteriota bacterium]
MSSPEFRGPGFFVWLVVAFFSLLAAAAGQSTGGRITGRVSDPTGAVVAGVTVTLTNEATGISTSTQTNDTGDYTFVEVAPA